VGNCNWKKTGLWFSPVQSYVYFQSCRLDLQTLLTSQPKQCQLSFGPPGLCLIVGGSGYVLMASVDWMRVVEGVVVKSFAVKGVTIDLSTTRHSNPNKD
jgi:hypothetical protein